MRNYLSLLQWTEGTAVEITLPALFGAGQQHTVTPGDVMREMHGAAQA